MSDTWFTRQLRQAAEEASRLPQWARREAGLSETGTRYTAKRTTRANKDSQKGLDRQEYMRCLRVSIEAHRQQADWMERLLREAEEAEDD